MNELLPVSMNTSALPKHVLVVGIDASGKSTFTDGLALRFGYTVLEPTSTPEARDFKAQTIDTPITMPLVAQREAIYAGLNDGFGQAISRILANGSPVASTGNLLVTKLSHAVMKQVVSEHAKPSDHLRPVYDWVAEPYNHPDRFCFTHAPFKAIRQRISERQQAGDALERFWGFNSIYFLGRYQDAWHEAIEIIGNETDIGCLSMDTSQLTPEEMLARFNSLPADKG